MGKDICRVYFKLLLGLTVHIFGQISSPNICTLEQVQNHIYGTSHFSEPSVTSVDECCSACANNHKCKAYTWADNQTCFLKDNFSDQGVHAARISGRISVNCTLQVGIEFIGNDVAKPIVTKDEGICCSSCGSDPQCKFFTYDSASKLCHHKNTNAPDYSRPNASCTSGFVGTDPPTPPAPVYVNVSVSRRRATTGPNFVCWNIDASDNRGFFWRNISAKVPGSFGHQLARQAAALGRAQNAGFSLLRFGGSGNDFLTYEFGGTKCPSKSQFKQCMNQSQWRDLLSFTNVASAKMIFGLSMNTGHDFDLSSGDRDFPFPWNPSNARQILQWTIDQKFDDMIFGLELGNEQNSKYTAAQQAINFQILHNLTIELWPNASARPLLFGPDPHSFHDATGKQWKWISDWIDGCKKLHVPIYGVTHHEYVEVDPSPTGFTSSGKLDKNGEIAKKMNNTVRTHDAKMRIFGGEIGPHNGGSPPCSHKSMRWATFGDSLWYADALASKAKYGYEGLCRQDYIGGDYGLVDCLTGTPLPDYYTALTWATTMGQGVLDVQLVPANTTSSVRIYAHCTAASESATASLGSVTALVINLSNNKTTIRFNATLGKISREYVLSPSNDPTSSLINTTGLMGTGITLNKKLLHLGKDGSVPQIVGATVDKPQATVPPTSIAFFVLSNANHPDCQQQL